MQHLKSLWPILLGLSSLSPSAQADIHKIPDYHPFESPSLNNWTQSNDIVRQLGGHMGHLQPDPAARTPMDRHLDKPTHQAPMPPQPQEKHHDH